VSIAIPRVVLLAHTEDPERLIAAAARLCYSQSSVEDIREQLTPEKIESFLDTLLDMGHESPIEHISFTFGIEGVSRSLTHQLVRHRLASYSQQSQRYVQAKQFAYIMPPLIAANPEACAVFEAQMRAAQESYDQLLAMGFPREDARYVLPNACETRLVMTMNARSLLNFFTARCCMRAQWEIRALAEAMLALVQPIAPHIFAHAGPNCTRYGVCREGAMSCGRIAAIDSRSNPVR